MRKILSAVFLCDTLFNKVSLFNSVYLSRIHAYAKEILLKIGFIEEMKTI